MAHKFALNQRVQVSAEASLAQASPDGIYTIVRLMPQGQDGQYGYRLKSQAGERVATESVLIATVGHDAAAVQA